MRRQILLSILFFLLLAVAQAQIPPQAFNYSAVARDANNNPIADTIVGIQISIRQASNTGAIVYKENHFVNTDNFGLFNLVIGAGNVQSGSMSSIEWGEDDHYLEVEMDVSGGTNFLIMGTTQLLSVPYALYAKTAGSIDSAGDRYVGELYGGGVVLWVDHTGQHGLILSMVGLSTSQAWSNITNAYIGTTNDWDGAANTLAIIGQSGHTSSAAQLCVDYTNVDYGTGAFSDWYLPSIAEFHHLWTNYTQVQKALTNAATTPLVRTGYWSSTEDGEYVFVFCPVRIAGNVFYGAKYSTFYVRAVRAF